MKIFSYQSIPAESEAEEARGVRVRWLITEKSGATNFAMRLFEIDPEGFSPLHNHPWEHEVYVLEGEGTVTSDETAYALTEGDVIFIEPNEKHQITNSGKATLKFLCMVPNIRQENE